MRVTEYGTEKPQLEMTRSSARATQVESRDGHVSAAVYKDEENQHSTFHHYLTDLRDYITYYNLPALYLIQSPLVMLDYYRLLHTGSPPVKVSMCQHLNSATQSLQMS